MRASSPRFVSRIFPAAIMAAAFASRVCAQQSVVTDGLGGTAASTNLLQPGSKSWKDKMLEKQFGGGAKKSFDFESGSLSGIAVAPAPSSQKQETSTARRRREQIEQMKFEMFMNAGDPSKSPTMDELMNMQGMDAEMRAGATAMEQFYLKELQNQRGAATNRAKAEISARNGSETLVSANPQHRALNAGNANPFVKNPSDARRAAPSGTSLFPDLFNPPASSPDRVRQQQAHMSEFRQMLNSRSPGGSASGGGSSSLGRNSGGFSSPSASPGVQPRATTAPAVPAPPAYQPPQQTKPPAQDYAPPKRKF